MAVLGSEVTKSRILWRLFGFRSGTLAGMLNPLSHVRDAASIQTYKVEPYVIAADLYTVPGNAGRGGWTWYTGSAGWYYRLVVEALLGFQLRGDHFTLAPSLPPAWRECSLSYTRDGTTYLIPACSYVEEAGSVTNSGRVLQWRERATLPKGNTKADLELLLRLAKKFSDNGVFDHIQAAWAGTGSDRTRNSCSPVRPSTLRDVTRTTRFGLCSSRP